MVTKEEVEQLMLRYFPSCPLCGADAGYEVSGFSRSFVRCRSCGAKWQSNDFMGGKELKALQLWEPSRDGRGASLKKRRFLVRFWLDSDAIERLMEEKEGGEGPGEEKAAGEIKDLFRKLKTKDPEVRGEVQKRLIDMGQPVLAKIREMLEKDPYTRKEASLLLGLMGGERAVEILTRVLKSDADVGVRCQAVASLGLIEGAEKTGKAIEPLIETLKSDVHANVRATAAMAMGFVKDPRVIDHLIQALRDSSVTVPGLLKRLTLAALGARWFGPTVGQTAAMSLVEIGKPAVRSLTQAMKKYDILDTHAREQAEEVLRKIRAGAAEVPTHIRALKNEDKLVRRKAAEALGKLGDSRAVEPLTHVLKDEDWLVRKKVVEALGRTKDPRAVEPLTQALIHDEERMVRQKAAGTLAKMKDPRAVEPLIQALRDENVNVRQCAAFALGDIGDERALEALTQAKEDKSWFVRSAAKNALKKIQKK